MRGPPSASVDETVLKLVLAEALSNARKYGDPSKPIRLRAEVRLGSLGAELKLQVKSTNRPGLTALTDAQLKKAFEPGFRAHSDVASSGVGLDNVKKALVTIGGNVWLTAGTSGGRACTSLIAALPTTLEGSFFDSSESFNSASSADTTPSATPQPSRPTPLPTRPSPQAGPAVPVRTLKVIGIDDDAMSRTVQCSLMEYVLAADLQVSGSIGGEQAERERFVDVALGALDLKLQPIAEGRPADVILIDQHIGADLLGTDVAASARGRGFGGVTVVLTGSSKGDVERIGALEHVDVCVEKGTPMPIIGAAVRRALAAKKQGSA